MPSPRRGVRKTGTAMTMQTWTRVGFRERDAYEGAIALVTGLGARSDYAPANQQGTQSSIWSVEEVNRPVAALGWQSALSSVVANPEHDDSSYLYFSPGAAEVLRHWLPSDWVHDPCEPPPAHLAVPLFGADDDSHFGSY